MRKPEPINKNIVCSECGLSWEEHGEKPTLEKCVELLKRELAKRPKPTMQQISGITPYYSSPNITNQ